MVLHLDTTDQYQIKVTLKNDAEILQESVAHNKYGSQVLLPIIRDLLKQQGSSIKDLKQIEVATGPGSFTGIRVGVSVANALGFALKIQVNGKEMETDLVYQ